MLNTGHSFFNNKVIIPKATLNWSTDSVLDLNYKISVHFECPCTWTFVIIVHMHKIFNNTSFWNKEKSISYSHLTGFERDEGDCVYFATCSASWSYSLYSSSQSKSHSRWRFVDIFGFVIKTNSTCAGNMHHYIYSAIKRFPPHSECSKHFTYKHWDDAFGYFTWFLHVTAVRDRDRKGS